MESKFISVDGIRLAYIEKNADADNVIFFIHGNSSSSRVWRKQFESELLANYRLVAVDLPSHGNSEELDANGDFSLPGIAGMVEMAVRKIIRNKRYIICGSSLGTNIVAEMLSSDLSPQGLLLAGPCIIGNDFGMAKMVMEGADVTAVFAESVHPDLVSKYAGETSLSTDVKDREHFLEDYYAVKGCFRSSLYSTITSGVYNDEIEILNKKNCPVCIVFGQNEKVVNTYYLDEAPINLWNKTIYKIPEASHLVNIDAPEELNGLLAAFSMDMFTRDAS